MTTFNTKGKAVDFGAGNSSRRFVGAQSNTLDLPDADWAIISLTRVSATPASAAFIFHSGTGANGITLHKHTVDSQWRVFIGAALSPIVTAPFSDASNTWAIVCARRVSGQLIVDVIDAGGSVVTSSTPQAISGGFSATIAPHIGSGESSSYYEGNTTWVMQVTGAVTVPNLQSLASYTRPEELTKTEGWQLDGLWYCDVNDATLEDLSPNANTLVPGGTGWPDTVDNPYPVGTPPNNTIALDRGAVEPYENGIIPTPQAVDFGANNDAVSLRQFTGTFDSSIYVATDQPVALFVWAQSVHGTTYDERLMWYAGFRLLRRGVDGQYRFEAGSGDNNIQSTADGTHSDGKWRLICGIRRPGNLCEIRVIEMGTTNVITGTTISTGLQGNQNQILFGTGNVSHVYRGVTAAGMVVFDTDPTDDQLVALANYADPMSAARLNGWDVRGYWKLPNTDSDLIDLSQYGRDLSRSGTGWSTDAITVDAPQAPETAVDFGATGVSRYFSGSPPAAPTGDFALLVATKRNNTPGVSENLLKVGAALGNLAKTTTDGQYNWLTPLAGNSVVSSSLTDTDDNWVLVAGIRTGTNYQIHVIEFGSTTVHSGNVVVDPGTFAIDLLEIGESATSREQVAFAYGLIAEGTVTTSHLVSLASGRDFFDLGSRYGWDFKGCWKVDNITELADFSGNGNTLTAQGSNWPTPVAFEQTPRNTIVAWRGGVERVAPDTAPPGPLPGEADITSGSTLVANGIIVGTTIPVTAGPIPGQSVLAATNTLIMGQVANISSDSAVQALSNKILVGRTATITSGSSLVADGGIPGTSDALDFGNPNAAVRYYSAPYHPDYCAFPLTGYVPHTIVVWLRSTPTSIAGSLFQYFYSTGPLGTANAINLYTTETSQASHPTYYARVERDSAGDDTASIAAPNLGGNIWELYVLNINPSGTGDTNRKMRVDRCPKNGTVQNGALRSLLNIVDIDTGSGNFYVGVRADLNTARAYESHLYSITIYKNTALGAATDIERIADGTYDPTELIGKPATVHWVFAEDTPTITDTIAGHVLTRVGTGFGITDGPFDAPVTVPTTVSQPADRGCVSVPVTVTDPTLVSPKISFIPRLTGRAAFDAWKNFFFVVDSVTNKTPTFEMDMAVIHGATPATLYWSYNPEDVNAVWTAFDNDQLDTPLPNFRTFSNSAPFTQNQVYVAAYPTHSYLRNDSMLLGWQGQPYFYQPPSSVQYGQFGYFGQAPQQTDETGRTLALVDYSVIGLNDTNANLPPWGSNRLPVVLTASQEAFADQSTRVAEKLIEFLRTADPAAVAFRERMTLVFYPLVNLMGRVGGAVLSDFEVNSGLSPVPLMTENWGTSTLASVDAHIAAINLDLPAQFPILLDYGMLETIAASIDIRSLNAGQIYTDLSTYLNTNDVENSYGTTATGEANSIYGYYEVVASSTLAISFSTTDDMSEIQMDAHVKTLAGALVDLTDNTTYFDSWKQPVTGAGNAARLGETVVT